jgi:hypothetical protein
MTERTFETRLARDLVALVDDEIAPFDALRIAQQAVGAGRRRWIEAPLRLPHRQAWLLPVLLILLLVALVASALIVGSGPSTPSVPSAMPDLVLEPTSAMAFQRSGHAAAVQADGRVLVTGGWNGYPQPSGDRMNHAVELFDASTGTFTTLAAEMSVTREHHQATTLADGRVLVTGGRDSDGNVLGQSELFGPATGSFAIGGDLVVPREHHVAVSLADGRIAVIGGSVDASGAPTTPTLETYDPATDSWAEGPSSDLLGDAVAAVLLPDGDVLVLDSVLSAFPRTDASQGVAVYDPTSGLVRERSPSQGGDLDGPLFGSVRGATLGPDERVLVALRDERNAQSWDGDDSGLYAMDPATGVVSLVARGQGRPIHGPVSLSDGRVVVLTDQPAACGPVTAWVIDPTSLGITSLGDVPGIGTCNGLPGSTLTALPDHSLLIAGGNTSGGETTDAASLIHPMARP